MTQVIVDERSNEEVTVIVALVPAQFQTLRYFGTGGLEVFGLELLLQEGIGLALVHQDRRRLAALLSASSEPVG